MTKEEISVKGPLTALATFTSYMLNTFNELIVVLLVVMILDYSSGIFRGIMTKSLNSTIGLNGIMKKMSMLIIVGLSACIEFVLMTLGMDTNRILVVAVISFFIVNEGISVMENSAQLGVPMPQVLYNALSKLREVGGKEQKVTRKRKPKGE